MIRRILHVLLRRFEAQYRYDASYMHEVVNIWPGAGIRYLGLGVVSQMRGPVVSIWAGAALASTLDGDCGPCAQLIVDMAVNSGVEPDLIAACLSRDIDRAGDVGLGFRFAESAIAGTEEMDGLREVIRQAHGDRAVIAASYAAATGRVYPVMKRALGHGLACQRITLGNETHPVVRRAA